MKYYPHLPNNSDQYNFTWMEHKIGKIILHAVRNPNNTIFDGIILIIHWKIEKKKKREKKMGKNPI